MTIGMALVDFIPVFMFLISAVIFQRGLYNKMSKGAFALFCAGTLMVFCAGFFKAVWKLLFAAGVCDFEKLNLCFMPMQATGFFLLAVALIAMLCHKQGDCLYAAAPAVFSGTGIFVTMMCLGIGVMSTVFSVIAVKLKKKWLIAVFVLAFVGMLGMGYLSSKDFADPAMNWIAEATNVFGQGMLLWGAVSLRKAGLEDFRF